MDWIDILKGALGLALLVIGWLIRDRVTRMDSTGREIKTELKAHVDREAAMLRQMIEDVDREALERDNETRAAVGKIQDSMPREFIMRMEFESRMNGFQGLLQDMNDKLSRLTNALLEGKIRGPNH